jgi:hypothetical protein
MAYKGKFVPKNPKKYKGDPSEIIFRSLWERKCMVDFDENPNVLEWSSEELKIPYVSPKDGHMHRYFPDFVIKVKDRKENIRTILIEVKPKKETIPPIVPKRKTKRYLSEVMTWGINSAKWKAAEEFCKSVGWEFKKITEDHLFPPKKKHK